MATNFRSGSIIDSELGARGCRALHRTNAPFLVEPVEAEADRLCATARGDAN
jgi:hypothetical protein